MKKEYYDKDLDGLIREAIRQEDAPSAALNNTIKAELYSRESLMRRQASPRKIQLWYLPMLLNTAIFALLAIACPSLLPTPWLSLPAAGLCIYAALAGFLLTVIGIRRSHLKEDLTLYIRKGDITA